MLIKLTCTSVSIHVMKALCFIATFDYLNGWKRLLHALRHLFSQNISISCESNLHVCFEVSLHEVQSPIKQTQD